MWALRIPAQVLEESICMAGGLVGPDWLATGAAPEIQGAVAALRLLP
jgi:hypothetical protein